MTCHTKECKSGVLFTEYGTTDSQKHRANATELQVPKATANEICIANRKRVVPEVKERASEREREREREI